MRFQGSFQKKTCQQFMSNSFAKHSVFQTVQWFIQLLAPLTHTHTHTVSYTLLKMVVYCMEAQRRQFMNEINDACTTFLTREPTVSITHHVTTLPNIT